ncbi:MAG: NAD-dependent deacylase [Calditrichaceae bacterium]|nr:NAD-dependent deacylase [Calditrichaceae bacterium]
MNKTTHFDDAVNLIKRAKHMVAFTGAGISVESGIPPFRGRGGLWNSYDPALLELDEFKNKPKDSWKLLKKLFYTHFGTAKPNGAHYALADLEENGFVKAVITQNIDNLHQLAGSKNVIDFHGNISRMVCLACKHFFARSDYSLNDLPLKCKECGGLIKPDVTFFGEAVPEPANTLANRQAEMSDVFLIIGSTGEVYPAALLPETAKETGAKIIEVNTSETQFTNKITDIFLKGKATEIMGELVSSLLAGSKNWERYFLR